jgi:hypothetical protein
MHTEALRALLGRCLSRLRGAWAPLDNLHREGDTYTPHGLRSGQRLMHLLPRVLTNKFSVSSQPQPGAQIAAVALALLIALILGGCGGGGGEVGPPPPAVEVIRANIQSSQTGIDYGYYLQLPADYAKTQVAYPVVYATDSEYRFATLSDVMMNHRTQAILVNVDATSGARRWVDFTMPGAAAYFRFLTQELIPRVESQYRIDPRRRIFSGHSLSGEFAVYALYLDGPASRYFSSVISEEGSFWYQSDMQVFDSLPVATTMEQQMYEASRQLPVNLVLAGDLNGNGPRVTKLFGFLSTRGYEQLRIVNPTYTLGHVPMDGPAFADALSFVLAAPPP